MKPIVVAALMACALVATGVCAADEANEGTVPKAITVDIAAQMRFGVVISSLERAPAPGGMTTTARVLDPSPLLQLDSELASAAASFAASRAEAQRTRKLFAEDRTASARAVEAASAQEQADLQRVNAARRQLALGWGGGLANLPAHQRAELLNELAAGKSELVRVEVPAGTPIPTRKSTIRVRGNSAAEILGGAVLGLLPTADPRLQTRGVLVELKGAEARLPIGEMLSAEIPITVDPPVTPGVLVPRSALLRRDSRVWVYVQTAPNTFVRREVHDYRPAPEGWFVPSGLAVGDRVVTTGASALLGVESPAPAETDTD
jgi:cobalt-zinc-cadmium efflux system membrane fusion protein